MAVEDPTRMGRSRGGPGADEPGGEPAGASLAPFVKALRRRWLLAGSLSLSLAALAAAGVWYGLPPPKHVASAVLHVAAAKPWIIDPNGVYGGEFAIYQQSQKALLTSRRVLSAALNQPKVNELGIVREQADPLDWLQRELKIDFRSGPEYMRLSLSGNDPEEVKVLVAAITDAYLREVVGREREKQLTHLEHLKGVQARYENDLRRINERVKNMRVAVGSGDPVALAAKQRYALEALGLAEKELAQLQKDLRKLSSDLAVQKQKEKVLAGTEVPATLVEQELAKDATIAQEMARYAELDRRVDALAREYVRGREEPSLRPMILELMRIQDGIDARRAKLRPQIVEEMREQARREVRLALAQLGESEDRQREHEKSLLASIELLRKQTSSLNVGQIDIEQYKQEIAYAEKITEKVNDKAELLKVEMMAPARVTLVEEAYVSQEDPFRRKVKVAGVAGAGTLFAVLGLVAWREHRRRRIEGLSDVQDELGIPMLGTIPTQPPRGAPPGGDVDHAYRSWQGLLTECVDGARTRLVHAGGAGGVRVVLVTSAVPREGKTSLASHLAVSLARTGRRTLLVDGDLRLPALDRLFDVGPGPGLAEVLRGEADAAEAVRPTHLDGLSLMPAGGTDLRAIQALSQEPLRALMARLREEYDYVVVDSAPVLPVVDSLLIGQHVDGVVLSVLRGVSHVPMVQAAYARLAELNIRVLGAVLNGADVRSVYGPWYGRAYSRLYQTPEAARPGPSEQRAGGGES